MDDYDIDFNKLIKQPWFIVCVIAGIVFISRITLINVNNAVWWDESQYLLMAKHNIYNTPITGWWSGRGSFYPNFLTLFVLTGYSELPIRFLMILITVGLVIFTYLLAKELTNKKTLALITALTVAFQWVIIFYTFRILRDIPAAFFMIASNYFFVKAFNSKKNLVTLSLISGFFLAMSFAIRSTHGIIGVSYLIYTFVYYKFKPKYYYWILGAVLGFLLINIPDIILYGNPLYTTITEAMYHLTVTDSPQSAGPMYYIETYSSNYGIALTVCSVIGFMLLLTKPLKKNHFFTLLIVLPFFLSLSVLTEVKELRYLIQLTPFFVFVSYYGAYYLIKGFTKNENLVLLILGIIFIIALFENVNHGYSFVNSSANSYIELKTAGEYIKSTNINTTIMSNSVPQLTYYSELPVVGFPNNESDFIPEIIKNNVTILIVSLHEPYSAYAFNLTKYNFTPIFAIPNDQPILIAYFVNQSLLTK